MAIWVTLATDEHVPAIAAFYREVWSREATPQSVLAARREAARRNPAARGEAPPTALVFEGGRIIGYCGSIPQRLWDGTVEQPAYWVKGLMVLPEYRNGPIGFLVVKQLAAALPRSTIMTVAPAARRLFSALGFTDLGTVANFVRPLRPATVARRVDFTELGFDSLPGWLRVGGQLVQRSGLATLAGATAGVALAIASRTVRLAAGALSAGFASDVPSGPELDELWQRVRPRLGASQVRDGLYLRGQFGTDGTLEARRYQFVTAREGAGLTGVAVLRRPRVESDRRLRGIRVATLSDIVFPPQRADVGLGLLAGVERTARAAGGDAILCSTSHPALTRLLRRQGYFRAPANLHFFVRDTTGARWPQELGSWWLARGDGGSDEVF